jgi:hypothetical protein
MGKVSRFRHCPPNDVLTVLEQGVEIIHQGLDFVRVCPFDPEVGPIAQTRQLPTQTDEWGNRSPKLPDSRAYAQHRKSEQNSDTGSRNRAHLMVHEKKKQMQ